MERFSEDGLRTFRACRFAAKLGFMIEDETFKAINKTLNIASNGFCGKDKGGADETADFRTTIYRI